MIVEEANGFELKTGEVSFDTGGGGSRHSSCVGSSVDNCCLDNYYLDGDM